MAELPDISDLLTAEKDVVEIQTEYDRRIKEARDKYTGLRGEVVQRYKAAGIGPEDCDHPVIKYWGMGEDQCECCGEARPQQKKR
jgi:hypothetical protein